jgi:hypothetical protein
MDLNVSVTHLIHVIGSVGKQTADLRPLRRIITTAKDQHLASDTSSRPQEQVATYYCDVSPNFSLDSDIRFEHKKIGVD